MSSLLRRASDLDVGDTGELIHERLLECCVEGGSSRLLSLLVVPVAGCRPRGVVGDGEPRLCAMSELEVVGRAATSHPRWNPAGIDGVCGDRRSTPCHRERECCDV